MRPKPFPAYEIGGKPVGIVTTVIVGVAVGVHTAEVIAVVVMRGTQLAVEQRLHGAIDTFYRNTPI